MYGGPIFFVRIPECVPLFFDVCMPKSEFNIQFSSLFILLVFQFSKNLNLSGGKKAANSIEDKGTLNIHSRTSTVAVVDLFSSERYRLFCYNNRENFTPQKAQ